MEIVNKVANSGLVTLNLEEFYDNSERVVFDVKPLLFQELILRENDIREFVKTHDWSSYQNKLVSICCTADAIVPNWAYMLIAISLQPYAKKVFFGSSDDLEKELFSEAIKKINPHNYQDIRVVIKGCSKINVPVLAYVEVATLLKPFAKSIMYGEPCSTVPLFKKAKT
jgi:hypothetical protein